MIPVPDDDYPELEADAAHVGALLLEDEVARLRARLALLAEVARHARGTACVRCGWPPQAYASFIGRLHAGEPVCTLCAPLRRALEAADV